MFGLIFGFWSFQAKVNFSFKLWDECEMKVGDMEGEGLRVYGRWQKLSDYNNKMKILRWALLPVLALNQDPLKSEVERAFLHMDLDGNGIVTKA